MRLAWPPLLPSVPVPPVVAGVSENTCQCFPCSGEEQCSFGAVWRREASQIESCYTAPHPSLLRSCVRFKTAHPNCRSELFYCDHRAACHSVTRSAKIVCFLNPFSITALMLEMELGVFVCFLRPFGNHTNQKMMRSSLFSVSGATPAKYPCPNFGEKGAWRPDLS